MKKIITLMPALLLLIIGIINQCHAVSLSTQKIHLDQRDKEYDFIIYNKESSKQICKISLKPYTLDETGKSHLLKPGETALHSADDFLKFSPQKFYLDIGQPQSVKFKLRVKRNTAPKEYRSYFAVDCQAAPDDNINKKGDVKAVPYLVHNIPIVVRIGSPDYTLNFSNPVISNKTLTATLNKTGLYSTYGEIRVINKNTKEIINKETRFIMPIEADSKEFSLNIFDEAPEALQIQYIESKKYRKSKSINFNVQ